VHRARTGPAPSPPLRTARPARTRTRRPRPAAARAPTPTRPAPPGRARAACSEHFSAAPRHLPARARLLAARPHAHQCCAAWSRVPAAPRPPLALPRPRARTRCSRRGVRAHATAPAPLGAATPAAGALLGPHAPTCARSAARRALPRRSRRHCAEQRRPTCSTTASPPPPHAASRRTRTAARLYSAPRRSPGHLTGHTYSRRRTAFAGL
jgi:hypothetical protein